MLLAAAPPLPSTVFTPPAPAAAAAARHTRNKPKLSLQISPLAMSPSGSLPLSARTPSSALSPTSRNTVLNRYLSAPSPASPPLSASSTSSSSSSSEDDAQLSPGLKEKHRLRRSRRQQQQRRQKMAMSAYQPSTPSASFMPRQPERRARELRRGRSAKRVGFAEEVVVHVLPEEVEEEAGEQEGQKPVETAMERAREIERLRAWVGAQGDLSEEEGREWVRKLVELEMRDLDMEE